MEGNNAGVKLRLRRGRDRKILPGSKSKRDLFQATGQLQTKKNFYRDNAVKS